MKAIRINRTARFAGCVVILAAAQFAVAQTPLGSEFTYQGRLVEAGTPVNGTMDLRFALYDASSAGAIIAGPVDAFGVSVVDGLFTVDIDFGATAYNGDERWLQIAVSPAGMGTYTALTPRQLLTAAPYAQKALEALAVPGIDGYSLDAADGNPVDAVYVDNSGKVGIGTTTPVDKLTISQGDLRVDRGTLTANQQAILTLNGARTGGTNPFASIEFSNFDSNSSAVDYTGARILSHNADGDADSGDLRFFTKATADANPVQRMYIGPTGDVGIGTSSPTSPLGFRNADERKITYWENGGSGYFGVDLSAGQLRQWTGNGGNFQIGNYNSADGTFIERMSVDGAASGGRMLLYEPGGAARVNASVNNVDCGDIQLLGPSGNVNVWMTNLAGSNDNGWIGVCDSTGTAQAGMYVESNGDGRVFTGVLQINGGSDLAEPFDVTDDGAIEPGMVVAIDPQKTGKLRLSTTAYDHMVAGVISGAGGVNPGLMMSQKGSVATGKHPVALTGRVYCWVDADAGGAVRPGDLLTTSNTLGHAMKVTDHERASGATIGKAMSSLESGRGLVLVLVNLQ